MTGTVGLIGLQLFRRPVADGHEVIGLDDLSDGTLRDGPEVQFGGRKPTSINRLRTSIAAEAGVQPSPASTRR